MTLTARLITLLLIAPAAASACDGLDPGPYTARYEQAEIVAVIRVVSLTERGKPGHVEGRAEVVEVLKGTLAEDIPVYAYTPEVGCFSPVTVGREYVVFLPNSAGRTDVWFSMFSKTARVSDIPQKLLRSWRPKT